MLILTAVTADPEGVALLIVDSGMSYQIVHLQILRNGKYLCKCTSDTHSKT